MFPVADVAAEFFQGTETPVVDDGQRERTQHAHIQRTNRFSLAEREEQPIGHVELFSAALRDVSVDRNSGRVRVLTVQYGSRVVQKLFCNEKRTSDLTINSQKCVFLLRMIIITNNNYDKYLRLYSDNNWTIYFYSYLRF